MAAVFVFLGLALQRLLYESNARLATAILVLVSAAAASILVNLAFHAGALIVATQAPFAGRNDELVLLMFELHSNGYELGGILFGLWLLPVGLIALRSPLFHRGVGVVLITGAIAWLLSTVLKSVPLEGLELVTTILTIPMLIAEFGLILYLLIVGVRSSRETMPADRDALSLL